MSNDITPEQFAQLCADYDAEQDYLDSLEANREALLARGDAA